MGDNLLIFFVYGHSNREKSRRVVGPLVFSKRLLEPVAFCVQNEIFSLWF